MPYMSHTEHGVHFAVDARDEEECKKNGWVVISDYPAWHSEQLAKKLGLTVDDETASVVSIHRKRGRKAKAV